MMDTAALRNLSIAAERNDPDALYTLGLLYDEGYESYLVCRCCYARLPVCGTS